MVQLKLVPVTSKNLFSRHYLDERLKTLPFWTEYNAESERVFNEIKKLYEKEKSLLPNYEESQLEENFIKPILRILGHTFEVQQSSDRSGLTPDYAFFPDEDSKREAQKNKVKGEFYIKAIAIGDAKKWGTPLDRKFGGRALYEFGNPSFQIDIYLRDTGVAWGVLTDGKLWRLYYREKNPVDSYYEVDLAEILESGSKSDFKYFYLFFRKEAFLKDATGKNFLEKVYSEGVDYAKKVSEDLEKNIYEALKILAQGFLAWEANNLKPTEEAVKEIHKNSLIFLYRILFILYANSRGMLKTYKSGYEYYDITKIKVTAFNKKQDGSASEHSSELWIRLRELFKLIDEGSESRKIPKEELYVPPYNGGLFKQDGDYKFLSENSVGDKYVADVLWLITVSEEEDSKGFIDYSTLEIRHLGSIYEGLLEYKLKIAEEDLVAVKEKDKQIWIPKNKANGRKILDEARRGELYPATDKGERKATGSYYTPDYIVKYIVENTLSPIAEEKLKGAATDEEKIERILSTKVLDPAMGSGHFLVEATNFLANKIIPFIPPEKLKEEKEIEWAKREVVKRCIYGIDLNPLATELAKLSLWLATISEERPLSFLDYHLKVGNSLIGADLQKLSKHPTEVKGATAPTFLSDFVDKDVQDKIQTLVNMHIWIAERAQETIQDIKNIEDVYRQFESNPFRQAFVELANLHTSYWLDNKFSKEEYYEALAAFRQFSKDRSAWEKVKEKEYFKKAQQIAKEKNFFHWHLEFPDIFFGAGNPGFDVVVGNPPWGATFHEEDKSYLSKLFESYFGDIDSCNLFTERGIKLIADDRHLSFITPNTWLYTAQNANARKFVLVNSAPLEIVELEKNIFEDAPDIVPIVFSLLKKRKDEKCRIKLLKIKHRPNDLFSNGNFRAIYDVDVKLWRETEGFVINTRLAPETVGTLEKIRSNSVIASDVCDVLYGIKTGDNSKFLSRSSSPGYVPTLVHAFEVKRYSIESDGNYLYYTPELEGYRTHKVDVPKIIVQYTRKISMPIRIMAAFDYEGIFYPLNTFSYITEKKESGYNLLYLMAVFSSSTLNFYHANTFIDYGIKPTYLQKHPIRRISFTTPEAERKKLVEKLKESYTCGEFDKILSVVDGFLPKDREGNFIADKEKSDVVHDFLVFLAEQMIETNKTKNAEIKGFLSWLEGYLDAKLEDLTQKTAISGYYGGDWENLKKALEKNKSKITKFVITRREPLEEIRRAFEDSKSKLAPLLEQIERTDKLIDQIVYKLYGLTEDEIKIVEGMSKF